MHVAMVLILGVMCGGVVYVWWRLRSWRDRVTDTIAESVALEVRRQDERIRKRVERSDGQDVEAVGTAPTTVLKPGDSWPDAMRG